MIEKPVDVDVDEDEDMVEWNDNGGTESQVISTVRIAEAYLNSRRHTLWGQSWNIKDKNRRAEAAAWLAKEVDRINAIRNMAISTSKGIDEIVRLARKMEL